MFESFICKDCYLLGCQSLQIRLMFYFMMDIFQKERLIIAVILFQLTIRLSYLVIRIWEYHHIIFISTLYLIVTIRFYSKAGFRIRTVCILTDTWTGVQFLLCQLFNFSI